MTATAHSRLPGLTEETFLSETSQNGKPMVARVLLVAGDELRSKWRGILEAQTIHLDCAGSREEAAQVVEAATFYQLLLIDADLKGSCWRELLGWAQESGKIGATIVLARHGDHQLWAEVLQLGAHDLISEPYERLEIDRIIDAALESQQFKRLNRMPPPSNQHSTLV